LGRLFKKKESVVLEVKNAMCDFYSSFQVKLVKKVPDHQVTLKTKEFFSFQKRAFVFRVT
jgi:hypothetical protein